jgi:predicted nucleic acid-binding Zn ribbon protein
MSLRLLKGGNRRRKRHESLPQEALDEPSGPPPEEYLYRCPACGEEMLVNEAMMDVAIGAAKCRGEYTGGMPTLGCPGCNGETMEYVESAP